jgi:hypothetical protein
MTSPCLVDEHDIWMIQGDDDPAVKWLMLDAENPDDLADLTDSNFELEVKFPGGGFTLSTLADPELAIDVPAATVTWNYPKARSAALPVGRVSTYYLRRLYATTRRTLVEAMIDVGRDPP